MRYEYIEPFVATTKKVLTSVLQQEVSSGDMTLLRGTEVRGDVSIVIKVTGDSEGCIIVNMDDATARRVGAVMSGSDCGCAPPLEMDAIAELSNMIAGNAASSLNDLGCDFTLSPPAVVRPADIPARTEGVEVFSVPLDTRCGEILVNVSLKTT